MVSNPTTGAVNAFVDDRMLGIVEAGGTGEFRLGPTDGSSLWFEWNAPEAAPHKANELSHVRYRIRCLSGPGGT